MSTILDIKKAILELLRADTTIQSLLTKDPGSNWPIYHGWVQHRIHLPCVTVQDILERGEVSELGGFGEWRYAMVQIDCWSGKGAFERDQLEVAVQKCLLKNPVTGALNVQGPSVLALDEPDAKPPLWRKSLRYQVMYVESVERREILGWWYNTEIDQNMLGFLKDLYFTGLILIPEELSIDEIKAAAKTLADNGMKWGVFFYPIYAGYEQYVTYFTNFKNTYDAVSPPPSWFVLDDFQDYVGWGSYLDAIRAADEVWGQDRYYINYNLELFNPHPHPLHPELFIKHVDYYDTPANTIEWLSYEIANNFSHKTRGAMVWTYDLYGCGWNQLTESTIRQLYDAIIAAKCSRLSFWNLFPGQQNNNLMLNPSWWPLIKELNKQFLEA